MLPKEITPVRKWKRAHDHFIRKYRKGYYTCQQQPNPSDEFYFEVFEHKTLDANKATAERVANFCLS